MKALRLIADAHTTDAIVKLYRHAKVHPRKYAKGYFGRNLEATLHKPPSGFGPMWQLVIHHYLGGDTVMYLHQKELERALEYEQQDLTK